MAAQPPQGSEDSPSLTERLHRLLQSSGTYLKARAQLLVEEGRMAGRSIVKSIVLLILGACAAVVAYLLLVVALVGLLMETCDWSVPMAAAIVAAAHALVALALLMMARASVRGSDQWFIHSRNEFSSDSGPAPDRTSTDQTRSTDS